MPDTKIGCELEHPDLDAHAVRKRLLRFGPSVDVVLFGIVAGELSVLLRPCEPPDEGKCALPGGLVELGAGRHGQGEELEETAYRVLVEAGLEVAPSYLEQLRTYGSPYRHPRVRAFSTAYIAVTPDHPVPDSGGARFFTVADLASHQGPQLVFDHSEIVHDALERLRGKVEWEGRLAAPFVAEPFSIPDLRRVYEAVWGGPVHRGDFRRKVLSVDGFLVPTGEHDTGTGGPPADLYRLGRATQFRPPMARRAMLLTKRAEEV